MGFYSCTQYAVMRYLIYINHYLTYIPCHLSVPTSLKGTPLIYLIYFSLKIIIIVIIAIMVCVGWGACDKAHRQWTEDNFV